MTTNATEPDWALLGELARARRERLVLKQGDLSHYGGPGGTTVGKIERAEQRNFPPRTRQQLERALGWKRGTVDEILTARSASWATDAGLWDDWCRQLVDEDLPDLTAAVTPAPTARDLTDEELLAELTYRMRRYATVGRQEDPDGQPAATNQAGASPVFTTSDARHLPLESLRQEASQPLDDGTQD